MLDGLLKIYLRDTKKGQFFFLVKFMYSEKATKFDEIFKSYLKLLHNVKKSLKIFVAFSEYILTYYMNFTEQRVKILLEDMWSKN